MRIGVDARHLSSSNNGIKTYLNTLLHLCIKNSINIHEWVLYSPYSVQHKDYLYSNVTISSLPVSVKFKGFHIAYSQIFIPILALRHEIDVFWFPGHRSSLLLPRKIAQVLTIHDMAWSLYPNTMNYFGRYLDKFFMPRSADIADIITTISSSTLYDIEKYGLSPSDKIFIISPGSDMLKFKKNEIYFNKTPVTSYFLFVGSIEPRKNLKKLLQAYSTLPKKVRNKAELLIVGGKGWGNVGLDKEIDNLDLHNNIKLLGCVDNETLAKLYTNARFLVMPSLYEGFGLPLVEAMSYGTPVLTANNSSMPEVAGNAGLLIDALDIESIANGLQEMIINNRLRERLANNAKLNASRFNWDESAKKLIKVFEKAIELRQDKLA
jgi:glycosyltransferase involved in cell wall biosynthesis